jgi:hypothetical protein
MVMVVPRPAVTVQSLPVAVLQGVDDPVLGQELEVPVNGREADLVAGSAQPGVNVLSAAKTGSTPDSSEHRSTLPGARGRPDTSGLVGHRLIVTPRAARSGGITD